MIHRLARKRSSADDAVTGDVPPVTEDVPPGACGMPQRAFIPRTDACYGPATEMLFARLTAEDIALVQERLGDDHRGIWDDASPEERKRLALAFGLHYGVAGVIERAGLTPATPPAEVHSMVHGWITEVGGSYYLADLVLESLDAIGAPLLAGAHALDFSCSSGRVVRPLAAARSDVQWHGCDPNADAIAWAREHIPGIDFFVSDTVPPLPFAEGTLDLVFAVSVWSHYSARAALLWLEELHRVVRPGGHVLFTTHGLQSCVWFSASRDPAIDAKLGDRWILDTAQRLEQDGHCFWNVFGDQGDWGVVDNEWGLAFFTPEWLVENVTPAWALLNYQIGRAHTNQDVYMLERR